MRFSTSTRARRLIIPVALIALSFGFGWLNLFVACAPELLVFPLPYWPKATHEFERQGILVAFELLRGLSTGVGLTQLILCIPTLFVRQRWVLRLHALAATAQSAIVAIYAYLMLRIPIVLTIAYPKRFLADQRVDLWLFHFGIAAIAATIVVVWLLMLNLRSVRNIYERTHSTQPLFSDRLLENIRIHGDDPPHRRAWYLSTVAHVTVLVIIPWLMTRSCIEPYHLPKGEGAPAVDKMVKIKKPKKKPKKRIVLNMNSAIIMHRPEIDDSKVLEELEQITENQYEANPGGKPGAGNKKGPGGWPSGMEKAQVRFIRLQYRGGDWQQDMGDGADYNFLLKFNEYTGFRIAKKTESYTFNEIKQQRTGKAPPFIYITGKSGISMSSKERKILRNYLLTEGGMLFADNGGGVFDRSFRAAIRATLPGYPFITIAHDDPILQVPYAFPNGAPPLWHHSGREAVGIKHNGRWVVFYHQGDINDAWKTGHSGADKAVAEQAYRLGVNVVYYAFTQYHRQHYGN